MKYYLLKIPSFHFQLFTNEKDEPNRNAELNEIVKYVHSKRALGS